MAAFSVKIQEIADKNNSNKNTVATNWHMRNVHVVVVCAGAVCYAWYTIYSSTWIQQNEMWIMEGIVDEGFVIQERILFERSHIAATNINIWL